MGTAKADQSPPRTLDTGVADRELVARCIGGDEEALRCLFARHHRYVWLLCNGMLAHRQDAEDAAQEALIRALKNLRRFRGDSTFRTWLHRIAVNVCLDLLRRRARTPEQPGPPLLEEHPSRAGDVSLALRVREALASLPPNYRAVLVMREVEGFSYAEIADALECSTEDVKNWLHRGRRLFRERYGAQEI